MEHRVRTLSGDWAEGWGWLPGVGSRLEALCWEGKWQARSQFTKTSAESGRRPRRSGSRCPKVGGRL